MQITNSTSLFNTTSKDTLLSKDKDEILNNSFESLIEEKNEDKQKNIKIRNDEKEEREALVKDLLSLLKTGFTESELERIKELLEKLETLKKRKSSDGNLTLSQIESTLKDLKTTLIEAQEKATGRSVRNIDEDSNSFLPLQKEIEEKINGLKNNFTLNENGTSLKENQLLSISSSEQLKLLEQLKQKNRV
ncbi:MAG: hypothetical protein RBQ84_01315 [Arcobacter sp.]|jgi:hypothetical protein|uniref:hypothetical protein n=1 Tax=Arcobacter sp. TaxID=1872629 RepID=UPI002A74DB00|nr:hypothetical protein [Arcobacter sp.]MDY3199574.1 hypothetical protein [Arcobacter sp.]